MSLEPNMTLTLLAYLAAVVILFAWWSSKSIRKSVAAFERITACPENITDYQRLGPDGDGYYDLLLKTRDGKEHQFREYPEMKAAQDKLSAVFAK